MCNLTLRNAMEKEKGKEREKEDQGWNNCFFFQQWQGPAWGS